MGSKRMTEEKESVIVVGSRPTLPNQQVDMAEECGQNLRCRGNYLGSSPTNVVDPGLAASTPAQASPLGGVVDDDRRAYPCFETPGSLADMCPDQSFLHLSPLEVKESPIESPSPSNSKLKLDQTYAVDSGYGVSTDISHGDSSGSGISRRSSVFYPFPNPEGSYVSNRTIWEMFTPIRDLKKMWRGRPSYLDNPKDISFVDKFSLEPQQILGFLMLVVILASVGFMFLISFRNIDEVNKEMNNKYKSIEYGRQKQLDRLREEGRFLAEVRDEHGNLLGGKKAAIQFSYDQEAKLKGDKDIGERGEDDLKAENPDDRNIETGQEVNIGMQITKSSKDEVKTGVEMKSDDDGLKNLENEVKELEEEKSRKLVLIEKVKMFNKQMAGDGLKPRKFRIVDGLSLEVKVPEESKQGKVRRRKSPANPPFKSSQKKLKMSKVQSVS